MYAEGARGGVRWFARAGFVWRRWNDETVVYDETRGATHLLDADSAQVLFDLAGHPDGLTAGALLGLHLDDEAADEADFTALERILQALRDAGLAECRPS
jgi:PqqD family protein of HPr-rel-A system